MQAILDDPRCEDIHRGTDAFWILARCLRDFVRAEGDGMLPVSGILPDMHADTEQYVQLQAAYHRKAAADADAIAVRVHELARSVGRRDPISDFDIRLFCKNAVGLRVLDGRQLCAERMHDTTVRRSIGARPCGGRVSHADPRDRVR